MGMQGAGFGGDSERNRHNEIAPSPGAWIEVRGAIEYCPATCRRAYVDGRLVPGQIEFPPEHAAIFVEEIPPDGYACAVPMVREWKTLAGHWGRTEPRKNGGRAGRLYLVNHDRRLAIGTAKLLPVGPFTQPVGIVVRPSGGIAPEIGRA